MQLSARSLLFHAVALVSFTRLTSAVAPSPAGQTSLLAERAALRGKQGKRLIPWLAKKQWDASQTHKQRAKRHRLRMSLESKHRLEREDEEPESSKDEPIKDCIACNGVQVAYGKYFTEDGDATDNSYYLFKDPDHNREKDDPLPIVIHFHGGGFYSGAPWKKENEVIKGYVMSGFAVVSVGYRTVMEKYFYEDDGKNATEELIKVDEKGKLTLDTSGRTMDDYEVRIGKQEFITKYLYDAAEMIDNIVKNAKKFALDPHRIVFIGDSNGGAGIHYLTWVYHRWNQDRYTPRGMILEDGQLNYPIDNMLDATWGLFVDTMGPQTPLRDVVSASACPTIVGNHMCRKEMKEASEYKLCNEEWDEESTAKFCSGAGSGATLAEAQRSQKWKNDDKEVGPGMEKLWYTERNMQDHIPADPFYIYVVNRKNGTDADDVRHHSVYALNFAKFAEVRGHQYTVYYTDFMHMTPEDKGMERFAVASDANEVVNVAPMLVMPAPVPAPAPAAAFAPGPAPAPSALAEVQLNYLSTHEWRGAEEVSELIAGSKGEQVLYACLAAGLHPFKANFTSSETTTTTKKKSGAVHATLTYPLAVIVAGLIRMLL